MLLANTNNASILYYNTLFTLCDNYFVHYDIVNIKSISRNKIIRKNLTSSVRCDLSIIACLILILLCYLISSMIIVKNRNGFKSCNIDRRINAKFASARNKYDRVSCIASIKYLRIDKFCHRRACRN